jgi:hypothetical protein
MTILAIIGGACVAREIVKTVISVARAIYDVHEETKMK